MKEQFWDPPALKTPRCPEGMGIPLALGHPIGASGALLAGESNGDSVPVGSGFQRRQRCLGRKNPMKPEVSWHTTFPEKSSVLYLLRPLTLERGCFLVIHALSSGSRTGGFWRATALKFRICHPAKSACSGVGGAAKWRGTAKRSLGMELHRRGRKRYINLPSRRGGVVCFALASLNTECTCMGKRNPRNTTREAPAWHHPMPGFPISWRCPL